MVERYTDQQLLDAGFNPALLPIIRRESGGKSVGWEGLPGSRDYSPAGTDLSGYPLKSTGFPAWPGKKGPEGNSTAAGVAQIVGSTWDPIARKLGVTDFSLESQARVANELYRQSGTSPWRASEPGYRKGGGGLQREGYYDDALHVNVQPHGDLGLSVGGALLLSNILKQSQQAEEPSGTGNALLDGILKAAATPQEEAALLQQQQPPQPAPVAPPPLPTVAPELQFGQPVPQMPAPQVPSGPMTPIPRAAPMTPMPGQPSVPAAPQLRADPYAGSLVPGTQDNPFMQPGPGGAPVGARDVPGTHDRYFWNEDEVAPYNPPGVPDDREQQASTGNSLLNNILKQFSPISTAQAAEREPPPPQPASQAQQQAPPANTGNGLLDGILNWVGQGEAGEQEQQSAVAAQPFYEQSKITPVAEALAEPFDVLARDVILPPFEAARQIGKQIVSGGELQPGTPEAYEAAASAAQLGVMGGAPRGSAASGFGRGPGGPRVEPPPIGARPPTSPGVPPVMPGTTRLYRGIGGGTAGTGSAEGGWFTTDPAKAALYGKVHYVDVTRDDLRSFAQGHGGPDEFVTDNKGIIGRAQPLEGGAGGRPPPPEAGERLPEPPAAETPPPPGVPYQELDDDIFRAQQTSQAERLQAQKIAEQLHANGITPADLEEAYHIRESRMTKRPLPDTNMSRMIEDILAPLDDRILQDAQWIYEHAPDIYGEMREAPLRTAKEGHVHRKVIGRNIPGEHLDPSEGDILTRTFLGGGGFSRRASGLMRRDPHVVWEDNAGNVRREWGKLGGRGPDDAAHYGQTKDIGGVRHTARQPTTRELTQRFPGRQYVEDLAANTIDNALRLGRVRRNIEILEKWKARLQEGGYWFPRASQAEIPKGFVDIHVPGIEGKADPMVASIINDVFRSEKGGIEAALDKINRVAIGSMFWLPIRHQLNVAAHYAIGRGFDWLYRNPNLLRATTQVATLGPDYIRYLKAGAGLRYASTQTENFYNTLLSKLGHDIVTDPEWTGIAKALGFNTAQKLAESVYRWSRQSLWKVNDIFLTARIMELERAGKPLNEAIRIAEQEIPNYRLPVTTAERGTKRYKADLAIRGLINSPLIAFGRYGYGRAKALVDTVKNLVGPRATGEERLHALGQAVGLIVIGTAGYTLANHALQTAQQQIGGLLPENWRKRLLGDKPLEFSESGPFGPVRETARYGASFLPKSVQRAKIPYTNETLGSVIGLEPEAEDWSKLLGSYVTGSPALGLAASVLEGGRNIFTGKKLTDPHKHLPAESVQMLEQVGGLFNPIADALAAARKGLLPGLGPQFGIKQQYQVPGKIQKMQRGSAQRDTVRDPAQHWADQLFGY